MRVSSHGANPILDEAGFEQAIEAVGPAGLLVAIEGRMSELLRSRHAPEDVLQEALLMAWRDRAAHEWCGLRAFRAWLMKIVEHRIHDLVDHASAQKRGAGWREVALSGSSDGNGVAEGFVLRSTTPSRVAIYNEQAAAIRVTLESLPDDVREVVRLRLFEQLQMSEIAERLEIGESAVRHRFRRGAELYEERLRADLESRSETISLLMRRCAGEKSS